MTSWVLMRAALAEDARAYSASTANSGILVAILRHKGMYATAGYRLARHFHLNGSHLAAAVVRRYVSRRTCTDIHYGADLGPGLRLPHPIGIVIGADVKTGRNCTLMQGATLGGNRGQMSELGRTMPTLGDSVFVGPGAVVVGPCQVASKSLIPANAVITRDIPPASPTSWS